MNKGMYSSDERPVTHLSCRQVITLSWLPGQAQRCGVAAAQTLQGVPCL
jgi:hypothetical protein